MWAEAKKYVLAETSIVGTLSDGMSRLVATNSKGMTMAHAGKKHIGQGAQGKGEASGARSMLDDDRVEENAVLSNRDKAQHSKRRGLDAKNVQTEQYHDHAANRRGDK